MQTRLHHLSDEEILLFIDRELPSKRQGQALDHFAQCRACTERRNKLESTLEEFSRLHEQALGALDSGHTQPRALLQARIANNATHSNRALPVRLLLSSISRQLVCAGIALLMVGAGFWAIREYSTLHSNSRSIEYLSFSLPRKSLTPGAVRPVSVEELCRTQAPDNDPPVNATLQQAVFNAYGLSSSSRSNYQLDYLITPALGGSEDIRNLWPQAYSSTWNARLKDKLEDHLHELVCQHKIPLPTAQNAIATDWISAYKIYLGNVEPLSRTATRAVASANTAAAIVAPELLRLNVP